MQIYTYVHSQSVMLIAAFDVGIYLSVKGPQLCVTYWFDLKSHFFHTHSHILYLNTHPSV